MALYRNVQMTFWTDSKVVDDFTPEDRYFYLYLITNPHTNLAGCYEISMRQMANETGYSKETIERLIARFVNVHKIIGYSNEAKEVFLLNWHKYSWTKSDDFRKAVLRDIEAIKTPCFKEYLMQIYDGVETVPRPSLDGVGTTVTVTVTDTDTVSDTDSVSDTVKENNKSKNIKKPKREYGEYKKVLLTDEEYNKLIAEYGQDKTEQAIKFLDEYIAEKGYKSKSHYLAMRRWVFNAIEEKAQKGKAVNKTAQQLDDFYAMAMEWSESE